MRSVFKAAFTIFSTLAIANVMAQCGPRGCGSQGGNSGSYDYPANYSGSYSAGSSNPGYYDQQGQRYHGNPAYQNQGRENDGRGGWRRQQGWDHQGGGQSSEHDQQGWGRQGRGGQSSQNDQQGWGRQDRGGQSSQNDQQGWGRQGGGGQSSEHDQQGWDHQGGGQSSEHDQQGWGRQGGGGQSSENDQQGRGGSQDAPHGYDYPVADHPVTDPSGEHIRYYGKPGPNYNNSAAQPSNTQPNAQPTTQKTSYNSYSSTNDWGNLAEVDSLNNDSYTGGGTSSTPGMKPAQKPAKKPSAPEEKGVDQTSSTSKW